MKVTVVGTHLCPGTLGALNKLYEADIPVEFKDIISNHSELRMYLHLRDTSELYADIRGTERIGIPLFIFEDGTMTMDLAEVLQKAK